MNEIIVRARGGLGNQLFQYAYAYALQKANEGYKIIIDAGEYEKYYWPFQLDEYELGNAEIYRDKKFRCDCSMAFFHVYQHFYSKLKKRTYQTSERLIKKGKLYTGTFSPPIRRYGGKDIYMYGYFQDAAILEPIRVELAGQLKLKNPSQKVDSYAPLIGGNAVAVSVRVAREEELANGERYVYDGADYYKKCLDAVKRKRGNIRPVIFSNDVGRIRDEKWFEGYDGVIYIEDCSATEQLELMRLCRDFIMANSTFSWWGAFLGSAGKDSLIICPRIWYEGMDIDQTKLRFTGLTVFEKDGALIL